MSDERDPLAWVAKAEGDLRMARLALRGKDPITSGACFHAQQCAEKYLKAMLVARARSFPKTHDLIELMRLCEKAGILVPIPEDPLDKLSDWAATARYPGTVPDLLEARSVRNRARRPQIRAQVLEREMTERS